MQYHPNPESRSHQNAAILVDICNVRKIALDLTEDSYRTSQIVEELIEELRQYVSHQLGYKVSRVLCIDASSGVTTNREQNTGSLLSLGVEPTFVLESSRCDNAAVELTVEACELLYGANHIDLFVLLSGDNWYVPLAHHFLRNGRNVIIASLETPRDISQVPSDLSECFLNVGKLLQNAGRFETNGTSLHGTDYVTDDPNEMDATHRPEETSIIDDPIARSALEIIESYFGQYREVYLTPLLRKLTELLEEEEEPKTAINTLEECGAVWLEKRRGFPHNYTVLIVNVDHPDVIELKETFGHEDDSEFDDRSIEDIREEIPHQIPDDFPDNSKPKNVSYHETSN